MRYQLTVSNETISNLAQTLTGYGKICGITQDGEIVYEIEAEDLWDAALFVDQVKEALEQATSLTDDFHFTKPVEMAGPGPTMLVAPAAAAEVLKSIIEAPDSPLSDMGNCAGWTLAAGCPSQRTDCDNSGTCLGRGGSVDVFAGVDEIVPAHVGPPEPDPGVIEPGTLDGEPVTRVTETLTELLPEVEA